MYVASVTALISRSDDEGDVGAYRRGGVTKGAISLSFVVADASTSTPLLVFQVTATGTNY